MQHTSQDRTWTGNRVTKMKTFPTKPLVTWTWWLSIGLSFLFPLNFTNCLGNHTEASSASTQSSDWSASQTPDLVPRDLVREQVSLSDRLTHPMSKKSMMGIRVLHRQTCWPDSSPAMKCSGSCFVKPGKSWAETISARAYRQLDCLLTCIFRLTTEKSWTNRIRGASVGSVTYKIASNMERALMLWPRHEQQQNGHAKCIFK